MLNKMENEANKVVYLLRHTYDYGDDNEHEKTYELGIYSNIKICNNAKKNYMKTRTYKLNPEGLFIEKFIIDNDQEWLEGFYEDE